MILVLHISVALLSVMVSTLLGISPTRQKLYTTICLIGATLVSGTYLVVGSGSHLIPACLSGLAYLGFVSIGLIVGVRKLANQNY